MNPKIKATLASIAAVIIYVAALIIYILLITHLPLWTLIL